MPTEPEVALITLRPRRPSKPVPPHAHRSSRIVATSPAAQSKPSSRQPSLTRDSEEPTFEVQDIHPPRLAGDQKSKEPSTHDAHVLDETISNTKGKSGTKESVKADPVPNAMKTPTQEDAPLNRYSLGPQRDSGFFPHARNIVMNNPVMIESSTNNDFMKEFAQHIIQGAELDSSARDPPPCCHPGTRVEIVDRMCSRLRNPTKRVQWLVGPAGVGKSAIMQTIAELEQDLAVLATLFFSAPNGRNDPSRVITSLAYQIALQHEEYCRYIRLKVKANPTLWSKSIDVQFTEFVIKPFTTMQVHTDPTPILMFIDGLDECKGQRQQIRILSLIFDFTTKYPQAPLLWVVASRPEAHITEYLNRLTFYDKEEVSIDSTEACQDVERFLRAELEKIRVSNLLIKSLYRRWPPEKQFVKLLAAILGLFAYAETVIRFIGDMSAGDPISRLQVILDLIDKSPKSLSASDVRGARPTALLDSLYQFILSQVSPDNIPHIEEILAYAIFSQGHILASDARSLIFMCNWIGMLPNVMYGALLQLHSVIYVPDPDDAHHQSLRVYHKSFSDFVLDPRRSGLSIGTMEDERRRHFLRSARVLGDIPYPVMKNDPQINITFSWPNCNDNSSHYLYLTASSAFQTMSSLPNTPLPQIAHALKVLWWIIDERTPIAEYGYRILFNDIHPKLSQLLRNDGVLQDIPVGLLDLNVICKHRHSIRREDPSMIWITPRAEDYSALFWVLIEYLLQAQAQSPDDLVRVFIGTNLIGIVDIKISAVTDNLPELKVFSFMYDFSTIYQRLKERREVERDKSTLKYGVRDQESGKRGKIGE